MSILISHLLASFSLVFHSITSSMDPNYSYHQRILIPQQRLRRLLSMLKRLSPYFRIRHSWYLGIIIMAFKNLNLAVGVSFAARINKINFVYPSCKRFWTTTI